MTCYSSQIIGLRVYYINWQIGLNADCFCKFAQWQWRVSLLWMHINSTKSLATTSRLRYVWILSQLEKVVLKFYDWPNFTNMFFIHTVWKKTYWTFYCIHCTDEQQLPQAKSVRTSTISITTNLFHKNSTSSFSVSTITVTNAFTHIHTNCQADSVNILKTA